MKNISLSSAIWCVLIASLFFACSMLFLRPYSTTPGRYVGAPVDPLLNSVTLWRIPKYIAQGKWDDIYDGRFFYPRKDVLAYSITMLPTGIMSWPVAALTGNPIAAHSFAVFLSFLLTGWFTYFLVKSLTRSTTAGIVAGILLAFSGFRFMHVPQVQMLTMQWVPLVMLCLHKYWDSRRMLYLVLAAALFAVQTASGVYLGAIFSIGVMILFVFMLVSLLCDEGSKGHFTGVNAKQVIAQVARKIVAPPVVFGLISAALLVVPLYPYFSLAKDLAEQREPTQPFVRMPATFDFPGVGAVILLILGWGMAVKSREDPTLRPRAKHGHDSQATRLLRVLNRMALTVVVIIAGLGYLNIQIPGAGPGHYPLTWPMAVFLLTSLAILLIRRVTAGRFMPHLSDNEAMYVSIGLVGYLLSFGPDVWRGLNYYGKGLFALLIRVLPPFDTLRYPQRFWILFLFAFYVLLGFSIKRIEGFFSERSRSKSLVLFRAGVVVFALSSISLDHLPPGIPIATREEMLPCYAWIAEQPEEFAILEVPATSEDAYSAYFAIFHNKRVVNGYSRWEPPEYGVVREAFAGRDVSKWPAALLDEVGVKYLLVHLDKLGGPLIYEDDAGPSNEGALKLTLVRRFGDCWVLQTTTSQAGAPIGPLFASRVLVFRAALGAGRLDQSPGLFPEQQPAAASQSVQTGDRETEVRFDGLTSLDGIIVDFHGPASETCPLSVFVEGEDGQFVRVSLSPQPSVNAYREGLFGPSFSGMREFTFPRMRTRAIRLRLEGDAGLAAGASVGCCGFRFKRDLLSTSAPHVLLADREAPAEERDIGPNDELE